MGHHSRALWLLEHEEEILESLNRGGPGANWSEGLRSDSGSPPRKGDQQNNEDSFQGSEGKHLLKRESPDLRRVFVRTEEGKR